MNKKVTLSGAVTISGLSETDGITESAFDGITVTLTGAAVENFSDLVVTSGGGESIARRIIWNGKVDGVMRNTVLIVDNAAGGKLKGGWLIFGEKQNRLTYYKDSSKLTAKSTGSIQDEAAEISLQFVDRETALRPRTFTFMEKYSLLSLGSYFDNATIESSLHRDIYISRTLEDSSKLNGVIRRGDVVIKDGGDWKFNDADSFVAETANNRVKFYSGSDD